MKKLFFFIIGLIVAVPSLVIWRFEVIAFALGLTVGSPPLDDAPKLGAGARWFDDYYSIVEIDEQTYAIAETRYWQKNFNYLILGDDRALLFDAGPGIRDIHAVVRSLTDLPLTFTPSHFHYDHVGNSVQFEHTAMIDLPYLRARAPDGVLKLQFPEHLGTAEGYETPTFQVSEWLEPGGSIDLGGRQISIVHTPGHTTDGLTLVDNERGYAFTGDFFYLGPLFAFLPNSYLGDYLKSVRHLLAETDPGSRFFGAHLDIAAAPSGMLPLTPELTWADLHKLEQTLDGIQNGTQTGEGLYPETYEVNGKMNLWTNPRRFHDWHENDFSDAQLEAF